MAGTEEAEEYSYWDFVVQKMSCVTQNSLEKIELHQYQHRCCFLIIRDSAASDDDDVSHQCLTSYISVTKLHNDASNLGIFLLIGLLFTSQHWLQILSLATRYCSRKIPVSCSAHVMIISTDFNERLAM